MRTYPKEIKSSLRLDSIPLIILTEEYFIVPLNFFVFLNLICFPVFDDLYFLHKPKSTIYIT